MKPDFSFYKEFTMPSAKWRGKPFWAWNGRLDRKELLRQIDIAREMGFGGFFMHSRTGLVTEYLGEEWFDLVNACADYAEEVGMEAWIYDEDRWPSGIAGGYVTMNPDLGAKYLRLTTCERDHFTWSGNIMAAFEAELDGIEAYQVKRIYPDDVPGGKHVLAFTLENMGNSLFYNGHTYLDTLNRAATDEFIRITHEKYASNCKDRLGKSIKGIFTDEPNRGEIMGAFFGCNEDENHIVPWTDTLEEEFGKAFGYSVIEHLPELFLIVEGRRISQVKWQFVELLQRMFLDHFLKPIYEWCGQHNMLLTGHALHEDSLTAQTQVFGSVMRAYEFMHYPGVDVLTEHNKCYWIAKQVQSAARQTGKDFVLSELYGCTGWQMSFENYKHVGDWQALFGINARCPHLSWYTMEGEAKRDYPASIFHQAGWHKEYKLVEDYFARIGMATAGERVCKLLVINPVESVWAQVYPGWASILASRSEKVDRLEKMYSDLFYHLCNEKIDFDYADEDMLGRLGGVLGKDGSTRIKLGNAAYSAVLISGMTTIRSSTLSLLEEFVSHGGTVLFAGDVPEYENALPSNRSVALAQKACCVKWEENELEEKLQAVLGRRISVADSKGEPLANVWVQEYRMNGKSVFFFLNMDREHGFEKTEIIIRDKDRENALKMVSRLDCRTGSICSVDCAYTEEGFTLHHDFVKGGELLLILDDCEVTSGHRDASENAGSQNAPQPTEIKPGDFRYARKDRNICVFDLARWRMNDEPWQPEEEILKIDRAVRGKCGLHPRGGAMIQPWYDEKFNNDRQSQPLCHLDLCYDFYVDQFPQELFLAMEAPEMWEVYLNGHLLTSVSDVFWVDKCYKLLTIEPALLIPCLNSLLLKCVFTRQHNLEALYLLGDFGVYLDGNTKHIGHMPHRLAYGDIQGQGMPFYSGGLEYSYTLPEVCGKYPFKVSVGSFKGAFVRVTTSQESTVLPWPPYEYVFKPCSGELTIEIFVTRRNTFGPLHQVPLYSQWYAPENFTWSDDRFTYQYNLVENGLFEPPSIDVTV